MILIVPTKVKSKQVVHGFAKNNVQLYVLANDGKWYLQPPVVFNKNKREFFATCYFGDVNSKSGAKFKIVAVKSNERPKSPVTKLPVGVKTQPICVTLI